MTYASLRLVLAIALMFVSSGAAIAQTYLDDDGLVLIWVAIKAYPGEGAWQACRRVYNRDVYEVVAASGIRVRCRIDHSRIYRPGEVQQNFNRQ